MTEPEHPYLSLALSNELPLERLRIFNMGTKLDIVTGATSVSWERCPIPDYGILAYYVHQRIVNPNNEPLVINTNFGLSQVPVTGTTIQQLDIIKTYLKMVDKVTHVYQP